MTQPHEPTILATVTVGEFRRFEVEAMLTRFGTLTFFVRDAERVDDLGLRLIVAQGDDLAAVAAPFTLPSDGRAIVTFLARARRKFRAATQEAAAAPCRHLSETPADGNGAFCKICGETLA